jgi:hypothetical protein
MTSNESDISHATEPVMASLDGPHHWPKGLEADRSGTRVKSCNSLVIHRTLKTVEEQFIFENSYPGLIKRNSWNQAVIWQACEAIGGFCPSEGEGQIPNHS